MVYVLVTLWKMITLKGNEIASAPLEEIAGKLKLVTEDNDLVVQGRRRCV